MPALKGPAFAGLQMLFELVRDVPQRTRTPQCKRPEGVTTCSGPAPWHAFPCAAPCRLRHRQGGDHRHTWGMYPWKGNSIGTGGPCPPWPRRSKAVVTQWNEWEKPAEARLPAGVGSLAKAGRRWSRRDSNPRPNDRATSFLHAYPFLGFRPQPGEGHPSGGLGPVFSPTLRTTALASLPWLIPLGREGGLRASPRSTCPRYCSSREKLHSLGLLGSKCVISVAG